MKSFLKFIWFITVIIAFIHLYKINKELAIPLIFIFVWSVLSLFIFFRRRENILNKKISRLKKEIRDLDDRTIDSLEF